VSDEDKKLVAQLVLVGALVFGVWAFVVSKIARF
jgi:hypothetical protein